MPFVKAVLIQNPHLEKQDWTLQIRYHKVTIINNKLSPIMVNIIPFTLDLSLINLLHGAHHRHNYIPKPFDHHSYNLLNKHQHIQNKVVFTNVYYCPTLLKIRINSFELNISPSLLGSLLIRSLNLKAVSRTACCADLDKTQISWEDTYKLPEKVKHF